MVQWAGPSYGAWEYPSNWIPPQIPTSADIVVIGGNVTVNSPVYALNVTLTFGQITLRTSNSHYLTTC